MTDDTLPQLLSAIQKSDDGDFLRVLAETTLNRLMDFDAEKAIGAGGHGVGARRAAPSGVTCTIEIPLGKRANATAAQD